jgi:hypothetical protein
MSAERGEGEDKSYGVQIRLLDTKCKNLTYFSIVNNFTTSTGYLECAVYSAQRL